MKEKRKITGYLIVSHSPTCAYFNGMNDNKFPWCLPQMQSAQPIGHKRELYLAVFRCGDTQCAALLGIRERAFRVMYESALAHLRNKGAPKKPGTKAA